MKMFDLYSNKDYLILKKHGFRFSITHLTDHSSKYEWTLYRVFDHSKVTIHQWTLDYLVDDGSLEQVVKYLADLRIERAKEGLIECTCDAHKLLWYGHSCGNINSLQSLKLGA